MTRKPKKQELPLTPPRRILIPLRTIIGTLVLLAISLAGNVAISTFRQSVSEQPAGNIDRTQIHMTPQPDWIAADLLAKVMDQESVRNLKWTDVHIAEKIADGFLSTPWIQSVKVKVGIRQATVEAVYRRPVLSVPWKEWACYVSSDGFVLPPDPEARQESFRKCFVVQTEDALVPPNVGEQFSDDRIIASARLADALIDVKDSLGLLAIIPRRDADGSIHFLLKTPKGSMIKWGSFDPEDDANLQSKLARLRAASEAGTKLDLASDPLFYDLTLPTRSLAGVPLRTVIDGR